MAPPALWLTLPGTPPVVAVAWVVWVGAAAAGAPVLATFLGPAGTVLAVLVLGWLAARRAPAPTECLRRYHLDDAEVTALGPGRTVHRLPWSAILTLTEERGTVVLAGSRLSLSLPRDAAGWSALLTRVVAGLAEEMWGLVEDGEEVRLEPRVAPGALALLWWAWLPALLACAGGAGARGAALAFGFALAERGVAFLRCGAGAVALGPAGLTLRTRGRRVVIPWADAEVVRAPQGLFVAVPGGACGLVPRGLPNFSAVAAVIETKARLGPCPAIVHFRVRVADGELAIVGEVEPMA
ncbi:MAG TPA: hypothetical protein VEM57_06020 [Candidatus Binatus sp.]|nr:hypothetical protein [Candidatus Binatus sp.]